MRRIVVWVVVIGVLIGMAVPRVAHACLPSPPYWKVTIDELQYPYNPDLPEGLTFAVSGNSIRIKNSTDKPATIGGLYGFRDNIISPDSSELITESDLYRAFFPSKHSDGYAFYSSYPDDEDDVELPPLTGEIRLTLSYKGEFYTIPITAYYDIDYVPSDGGAGCSLGYAMMFGMYVLVPLIIAGIVIGGIVAAIRAAIRNRRAAP